MNQSYVFCACGDPHVRLVNQALRFLKRFSRKEILVVTDRTFTAPDHDQWINVTTPTCFDDHQAGIFLKTCLHRLVGTDKTTYCYLDSDVLAVSACIDTIFDEKAGPVTFAHDHTVVSQFSRFAVNCSCRSGRCNHMIEEIWRKFGVEIGDPNWQQLNGGVFLFDDESTEFMDTWHDYALVTFEDAGWKTRDQGTLCATIWKYGLQDQATLPQEYNYLVDPFYGLPSAAREGLTPAEYTVDDGYSLTGGPGKVRPFAVHLINGGAAAAGWKNYDDARRLLESTDLWRMAQLMHERKTSMPVGLDEIVDTSPQPSPWKGEGATDTSPQHSPCQGEGNGDMYDLTARAPSTKRLTKDNRMVHGMWIGKQLSKLELLTLHSFVANGHEFCLWCYDDLKTPVPKGVTLMDAREILPASSIYRRRAVDAESGVGKGSYGPFSDLFRYKLLHEKGGYWADMDVTCLRPLDFKEKYVFRSHRVGVVGNIMKCPAGDKLMKDTYERTRASVNADSPWLMTNRILSENVERYSLDKYVRPEISNPDSWAIIRPLVWHDLILPSNLYVLHWCNEYWRTLASTADAPDKNNPPPAGTLARLYGRYGL